MPDEDQKGADYETDPQAPENVHDAHDHGAPQEKAPGVGKQAPVPKGDPRDPTRETWERINREKVHTTKEEMPSPENS